MRVEIYSYRFAQEILQHSKYKNGWNEIMDVISNTPLFVYPGKSKRNSKLDVVQQVMNTYFDRRLSVDLGWEYHPLATDISNSALKADFRKTFDDLTIQAEVQFGNAARWYSDIFKFQTAYSQSMINLGLCVIPTASLARRIDSNVVQFERTGRELPSAELSITLPIILAGIEPDDNTPIVDVSQCQFKSINHITGKGYNKNKWRIVHGYLNGVDMRSIGPDSDTGPMLAINDNDDE
ncbi:MAG: BglII/BstYI family type II restriction endonuclease [Syntrophomonadaceae bacterium]|jgi:hypothetical protein